MFTLEQITTKNALMFKAVRLQALQDSPTAFGSNYAKEIQLSDADWLKRAADWSNDRSVGYLAIDRADPCGIAAAFLSEDGPRRALLISMWVAPAHRRTGAGGALIAAIERWARIRGAISLRLHVTSGNLGAIAFYKRCGFAMTGNTEPYPNDPALFEHEMAKSITGTE